MRRPGTGEYGETAIPAGPEEALYSDLCTWREQLARSIARANIGIRSSRIGQAADRVIFALLALAIAEDRHLVDPGTLRAYAGGVGELSSAPGDFWAGTDVNARAGKTPPENPVIDRGLVEEIARRLTDADRPYNLSQVPLESVAAVLDRYLARTVRRSAAHQAVVVDRPDAGAGRGEIMPALLHYAAGRTLDAACTGRSPDDPLPLRMIDPACGAGVMLLYSFHYLRSLPGQDEPGDLLRHTIHGLDPNPHAVAAARMLLALEACGDSDGSASSAGFFATFREYLAILSATVRCGNALVGPEIANDELWAFCPVRERHELRPFAWQEQFPEILLPGGFDAVLCCSPDHPVPAREWLRQYFQRHYSVYDPEAGLSAYVIEKSLAVLQPRGVAGIICSDRWLRARSGAPLRSLLLGRQPEEIVTAGGGTCYLLVTNARASRPFVVRKAGPAAAGADAIRKIRGFPVDLQDLTARGWALRDTRRERLVEKISRNTTPLGEYVPGGIRYGAGTGPAPGRGNGRDRIMFSPSSFPPHFEIAGNRVAPGPGTGIIPSGSRYLLGLLNSRLAQFLFCSLEAETGEPGGVVARFPVVAPDFDNPNDVARHGRLEALVTEKLALSRHLAQARSARERQAIGAEIASTGKQIESLVYGIYGLSVDDIAVVEETLTTIKSPS
ncbi:Eco57I restriction-modification methylase domain-containing protein [Methanoregula sp.]|uniref:Eco57I restriction-modification methylase domain-containing protein n=1 Tax=Methanoregula sp. TaxID=2052170 RepID=UPI002D0C407A|nr:hypothetical protein [Methanoregula sp.]HVP96504.1 hypothetical protein [Methanoregula sp.]